MKFFPFPSVKCDKAAARASNNRLGCKKKEKKKRKLEQMRGLESIYLTMWLTVEVGNE